MHVFSTGLLTVMAVTERLPVTPLPEQNRVASVRFDVVDVGRPDVAAGFHALRTQRVRFQKPFPCFIPPAAIAPAATRPGFFRVLGGVFIAVFLSPWHQPRTAGMGTWVVWYPWHSVPRFPRE